MKTSATGPSPWIDQAISTPSEEATLPSERARLGGRAGSGGAAELGAGGERGEQESEGRETVLG
ncbi:MAG: hypothetical protein HC897_10340 [Thermoanaerobaculia bacterium]|nr:hypothetical protein [Thermoanaerobaculia bacterium]